MTTVQGQHPCRVQHGCQHSVEAVRSNGTALFTTSNALFYSRIRVETLSVKNSHFLYCNYLIDMQPAWAALVYHFVYDDWCASFIRSSEFLFHHSQESRVLQTEYARIKQGQAMEPLDTQRYKLAPPPLARQNDVGAWKKALENAHSQLEHQHNRCCACPRLWLMSKARHLFFGTLWHL